MKKAKTQQYKMLVVRVRCKKIYGRNIKIFISKWELSDSCCKTSKKPKNLTESKEDVDLLSQAIMRYSFLTGQVRRYENRNPQYRSRVRKCQIDITISRSRKFLIVSQVIKIDPLSAKTRGSGAKMHQHVLQH